MLVLSAIFADRKPADVGTWAYRGAMNLTQPQAAT